MWWHACIRIPAYSVICAEGCALGILLRGEDVGLMSSSRVPRAGEVVSHHVPKVEILVHLADFQPSAIRLACRRCNS